MNARDVCFSLGLHAHSALALSTAPHPSGSRAFGYPMLLRDADLFIFALSIAHFERCLFVNTSRKN